LREKKKEKKSLQHFLMKEEKTLIDKKQCVQVKDSKREG
jgi:hypothetical protein